MGETPIDCFLSRRALQESGTSRYVAILVCYKDSGELYCYSEPGTDRLTNFWTRDSAQKLVSSLKKHVDKNKDWQVYEMKFGFEKVEKKE